MNSRARAAVLLLVAALSACAASTTAVIESLRHAVQGDSTTARAQLNPKFRYLRAAIDGRTVLLVLGYVENHPQGPIQVWYSAEREVLRLQNGRIAGAVGLTTEWRNVTLSASPSWSALAQVDAPSRLVRVRDVMPGYRYGVEDILVLRVATPPSRSALLDLDPQSLTWFEESVESDPGGAGIAKENALPVARYAVTFQGDTETVVYGEQCLSPKVCFAWQRWPAAPQNAKGNR